MQLISMMRSVMLGVRSPGAEPLRPINRYVRLRVTRQRPCGARPCRGWAAADGHGVLQAPSAQHQRTVTGDRDRRRGDDENDEDAQAHH